MTHPPPAAPHADATRWALLGILLLAAALRLPWLGQVPGPLHPDEAAYAADARELSARPFLIVEHEAAGWVAGTYAWLAAPLLATPLTPEFAARLPSALAGLLGVGAVFLLGRRLSGDPRVGLLAALALATAPWAYHHARLALGPSLIAPLVAGGLWALLDGAGPSRADAPPRPGRAALGALLLLLAVVTYAPARLIVPPLATLCLLAPPGPRSRRAALAALLPIWLVFAALLPYTLLGRGSVHLHDVLVWDPAAGWGSNLYGLARGYAVHLSPRHLFSGASSRGFAPEGLGLLPLWQAPLLVAGLVALARRRDRVGVVLGGWLLLHPLAAAFTRDVPNAIRAGVGSPAFALVVGLGGVALADTLAPRLPRAARRGALLVAALVIAGWTASQGWWYVTRYPDAEARFYYAGRREVVQAAAEACTTHGALLLPGQFWQAYLRLYAPGLPYRRGGAGWILGEGEVRARVEVAAPGDPPRVPQHPHERVLVPDRAVLSLAR